MKHADLIELAYYIKKKKISTDVVTSFLEFDLARQNLDSIWISILICAFKWLSWIWVLKEFSSITIRIGSGMMYCPWHPMICFVFAVLHWKLKQLYFSVRRWTQRSLPSMRPGRCYIHPESFLCHDLCHQTKLIIQLISSTMFIISIHLFPSQISSKSHCCCLFAVFLGNLLLINLSLLQ